jgi:NADH-quinone oxidoreductase subunit C
MSEENREPQNEPQENLPAVNPMEQPIARKGMFGVQGSGDTSGYGGLVVRRAP